MGPYLHWKPPGWSPCVCSQVIHTTSYHLTLSRIRLKPINQAQITLTQKKTSQVTAVQPSNMFLSFYSTTMATCNSEHFTYYILRKKLDVACWASKIQIKGVILCSVKGVIYHRIWNHKGVQTEMQRRCKRDSAGANLKQVRQQLMNLQVSSVSRSLMSVSVWC